MLPLGVLVYSLLSLFILAAGVLTFFSDAWLNLTNSCVAFRLEEEGGISLMLRGGRHQAGKLAAGGVILPFIVLLNVLLEHGGRRSLVLLSDSTDADSFRRLRVVLRWGAKQQDPISSV
jgi:toxin CptA